jgi:hypothetical protein
MADKLLTYGREQMNTHIFGPTLNVSLTAALATNRERKGQDHAYLAMEYENKAAEDSYDRNRYFQTHIVFDKSLSRTKQENTISCMILKNMWEAYHETGCDLFIPNSKFWTEEMV